MHLRRSRRRVGTAAGLLLVAAMLSGCAPSTVSRAVDLPAGQIVRPVERAELRHEGARIVDDAAAASMVVLPKQRNGGLVVFVHGWGQTHWSLLARRMEGFVTDALGRAGYTVLSADAGGKAWGDPASVRRYEALITTTQRQYGLQNVFLMGESMGGLATMQLARLVPDVRAVTAWYPVCDLRTMGEARFQETIRAAWSGRSRAAVSPVAVGSTPMLVWASPVDTVVDAATNAAVCVAEARRAGAEVTYFHTTGQHGDPSNFDPAAIVQFFDRHSGPGV